MTVPLYSLILVIWLSEPTLVNMSDGIFFQQKPGADKAARKGDMPDQLNTLPAGLWGGPSVALAVQEKGATLEFDCGHGNIEAAIRPDKNGHFEVMGTYQAEVGGPHTTITIQEENEEGYSKLVTNTLTAQTARYLGHLTDQGLKLTVVLIEKEKEHSLGVFNLKAGQTPRLRKCL